MKKILFILAFSNALTSELILEITQGTEDPYRVAILKFEGDQKVSNDIDKIIRNNLKRSGEFNLFTNEDLLSLPTDETEVIFNDFKILNIDYLVIGKIVKDGISISVVYDIFDINKGKKIRTSTVYGIPNKNRQLGHYVSDGIYEEITGMKGISSTKILYVTENKNFNLMIDKLKEQQNKLLINERYEAWESVARKLAHEIKNPLTPIALATDRLQKKYRPSDEGDAEKFDDYVSIISRQVDDIGRMVEEFSQFARMPAPVLKKLDARKLLTEQKILLDPNSQVSLDIKLPEDDAPVYISADAGLMRQVITNLTKNSVENMQDNNMTAPKIQLSLQATDERAEIEVRDYGSGFPGEDTSTFLEPYVTTREKGTGLGLAIAQKIISDHFGEIRLDNHPEVGAVVTLSMPLAGGEE